MDTRHLHPRGGDAARAPTGAPARPEAASACGSHRTGARGTSAAHHASAGNSCARAAGRSSRRRASRSRTRSDPRTGRRCPLRAHPPSSCHTCGVARSVTYRYSGSIQWGSCVDSGRSSIQWGELCGFWPTVWNDCARLAHAGLLVTSSRPVTSVTAVTAANVEAVRTASPRARCNGT